MGIPEVNEVTERQLRKALAANIKAARAACGLSQHEAARQAKVSQAHWSMAEGGSRLPTLSCLVKMTRVLDCSVAELVTPNRGNSHVQK